MDCEEVGRTMELIPHFISGARVPHGRTRTGAVFNPSTGAQSGSVALATAAELDRAVKAAKAAQPAWAAVNPQRRARVMFRFKELLEREMEPLARLLSAEHGKVIADS